MEVITLDKTNLELACGELMSKIDFRPDLVVGIANGGIFLLSAFGSTENFKNAYFKEIKPKRKVNIKNNFIVRFILRRIPVRLANYLRLIESKKIQQSLGDLDLNKLTGFKLKLDMADLPKEKIEHILIVDDAIDTGKTMFVVKNNLNRLFTNAQIKTAVLSWTLTGSIVKPDYYMFKDVLVRYPWSKDFKERHLELQSIGS
ncbi:MAG: phosphoribosyltransferase [Aestuariibaculum sp.]